MRAWLLAVLAAALVWTLPLVGPHAAFLVGPSLWRGLSRDGANDRFWLGLAAGLAVHLALALLLCLLRRGALWVRVAALLIGLGGATVALNAAFLVGIPTLTLIERDARPDRGDLPEACAALCFDMPFAPTPALAARGRVLLRPVSEGGSLAWLSVPGCAAVPTAIPSNVAALSSEAGGTTLYALMRPPDARYEWFLAAPDAGAQPVSLAWHSGLALPVLLEGGSHVGHRRSLRALRRLRHLDDPQRWRGARRGRAAPGLGRERRQATEASPLRPHPGGALHRAPRVERLDRRSAARPRVAVARAVGLR